MKKLVFITCISMTVMCARAQLYITKTGFVGFYSKTPLEDIKAENNQVFAAVDLSKKTIAFSMLLKGFLFRKELMQEHFNENYVESDKYPRATFSGTFSGDVDPAGQPAVTVQVKGKISLHGVEKEFSTPATIEIKDGVMNGTAKFQLLPQDFNIAIPSLVREKIAKQIDVVITIVCKPAK